MRKLVTVYVIREKEESKLRELLYAFVREKIKNLTSYYGNITFLKNINGKPYAVFPYEKNLVAPLFEKQQNEFATGQALLFSPYISQWHFNISHTEGVGVVVFSRTEIGVDIEWMDERKICIADRFFCDKEREYIRMESEKSCVEKFYEVWTQKEALIKFRGESISRLRMFDVKSGNIRENLLSKKYMDYMVSVCCKKKDGQIDFREICNYGR